MDKKDSNMNKKHYTGINLQSKESIKELTQSKNDLGSSWNFI
jgi:hypothetical protein